MPKNQSFTLSAITCKTALSTATKDENNIMGYEKVGLVDPKSLSTRGTGIWGAKTRKYILLVHLARACLPHLLTPLYPLPCRALRDFWVWSRAAPLQSRHSKQKRNASRRCIPSCCFMLRIIGDGAQLRG